MARLLDWLKAFEIDGRTVRLRKTGAVTRLDLALVNEVLVWSIFYICVRLRAAWRGRRTMPLSIVFMPDQPGPWYLIHAACVWAGLKIETDPACAAHLFFFEDATWSDQTFEFGNRPCINIGCRDISKSHVATIFEAVFGYSLRLDPQTHVGPAVEKSEVNARHDGQIVDCPRTPRKGFVYQKLIETSDGRHVHDLRTPCVAGNPVVVWEKLRPLGLRFAPHNDKVITHDPQTVFSPAEHSNIRRFCAMIGLDWGGLDILRDVHDGRIYIVDVNKTDAGPVTALPLREKLRSTALLATALCKMIERRTAVRGTPAGTPTSDSKTAAYCPNQEGVPCSDFEP